MSKEQAKEKEKEKKQDPLKRRVLHISQTKERKERGPSYVDRYYWEVERTDKHFINEKSLFQSMLSFNSKSLKSYEYELKNWTVDLWDPNTHAWVSLKGVVLPGELYDLRSLDDDRIHAIFEYLFKQLEFETLIELNKK